MAIAYPINTPTNIGIANITFMAESAVAISQSPFTFQQQIVAHQGQRWAASITLPPMKRQDAEPWVSFLLSLKGQVGTFLLGDPNCGQPQGSALSARKNLLIYSEQFDNAAWSKSNATITTNSIAAPDGLTTADTLVENTATSTHAIFESIAWVAGTTYTFSVYAKEQSARNIRLTFPTTQFGGVSSVATFDTTTGAVLAVTSGLTTAVETLPNGWFRFSITKAATVSSSGSLDIRLMDGTSTTYLGDGTSGVYIWGAQLEQGSVPTSYQPIADTYGPFVNGVGQTGGELIIDGASPSESSYLKAGDYIQIGTGSSTNLYKVLSDVSTNESGQATIDIWPNLRSSPADNAPVVVANTVGRFRLKEGVTQWSINEISSYGITFDCVEAL